MNWRAKSSTNKRKDDRKGILMVMLVALIAAAGAYLYYRVQSEYVARDETNLCRIDSYVSQETVLLLDATDSFTESHQETVLNHLRETLRISKQDEQFTLYSLNDDLDTYQPTLIICNPGDGQESSELTANIQLLTQTWEQDFYQKIVAAVESQMIIDEADNSPIMEMFKFVGIRSMFESTAPEKRIIVISDMVEHTSSYSQYTQSVDFQTLKDSPYFREVRPSLDNVDVEMLYIERPELAVIQRRRHITFWENLIDEAGGRITLVEPIN